MKVELSGLPGVQTPVERSARPALLDSRGETQRVPEDRTTFASDVPAVQPLVRQALAFPAVRQDKVEALRQAIASGAYQIDLQSIAAGILAETVD